jgi:hypothetical protein
MSNDHIRRFPGQKRRNFPQHLLLNLDPSLLLNRNRNQSLVTIDHRLVNPQNIHGNTAEAMRCGMDGLRFFTSVIAKVLA